MHRSLLVLISIFFHVTNAFAVDVGYSHVVDGAASGDLGSPISGSNGKIYIADSSNSRLIVIAAATDAVSSISLPGQPETSGGALSVSKDNTLLAVPLKSGNISIVNLSTGQVTGTFDTSPHVPISTAFGASNDIVFFSTDQTFDVIYVLNTTLMTLADDFGIGASLSSTGTDLQLSTDSTGNSLYVLERFGSPGGLHKIDVTTPTGATFIAEDDHGDLGSNCRGLAVIPGGVAAPTQGHEAYIACGSPYYGQAIKRTGAQLLSTTQFTTEEYPIAAETLPNGDVVFGRDTGTDGAVFMFDSSGVAKKAWGIIRGAYVQMTSDGIAGIMVNDVAKIYATMCANQPSSQINCYVVQMGGPNEDEGGGGGDDDDDDEDSPAVEVTLSKTKLSSKGGKITITATIDGEDISDVTASVKKGSKTLRPTMTPSEDDPSVYTGMVTIPKNKAKKTAQWSVTVSATVDEEDATSDPDVITVGKKRK